MKVKEEIILTDDQKQQLNELSDQFMDACNQYTSADNKKKALNTVIKSLMADFGVNKFVSDSNVSLSMSSRPNIVFDEDKLLALCKELNIDGLVKTKEYVDMNVLESAMYHDSTLKTRLKEVQIVKPDVVTLKCTQKKALNE